MPGVEKERLLEVFCLNGGFGPFPLNKHFGLRPQQDHRDWVDDAGYKRKLTER